jgi:hypothetical protein
VVTQGVEGVSGEGVEADLVIVAYLLPLQNGYLPDRPPRWSDLDRLPLDRRRSVKEYEASAMIEADPFAIWAILTDASGYSHWDSGVERIEGTIAPGEKIKLHSEANPGRAFPVRVTEFAPPERMTWKGGMPLGLFKGVRTFSLSRRRQA